MKIRVSKAKGSQEFVRMLVRLGGAKCLLRTISKMPFGDFWFWGNGPNGRVKVGIERKTLSEIVGEISNTRFMGHQLPGFIKAYDYRFVIIEGDLYIDRKSGLLNPKSLRHLPRSSHLYHTVQKYLTTLMLKGGVRLIHTKNKTHTAMCVCALADWFDEPWKKHKSVYQVEEDKPDSAILDDRTLKRQVANQLTGLRWVRSLKADKHFPSIVSMIVGDTTFKTTPLMRVEAMEQWRRALGFKKVGATVRKIVDVCYAKDDVNAKGR